MPSSALRFGAQSRTSQFKGENQILFVKDYEARKSVVNSNQRKQTILYVEREFYSNANKFVGGRSMIAIRS